jgi:peptidoglycan pentaglycine glycine transferase (the first glycine)
MAVRTSGLSQTLATSMRVRRVDELSDWTNATSGMQSSILQGWRWGEFKRRHGWEATRLVVEESGQTVAAAQVLRRPVGPMSVLYIPRGPFASGARQDAFSMLTLEIDRLAASNRAAIAFLEPNDRALLPLASGGDLGWSPSSIELQPLRTIKVRVDRDDEEILGSMKSKTRYNVRLAGRRGVQVRAGTMADIPRFFELLEETSSRDEFGVHGVEYYADMLDVFGDDAILLLAEFEGELAAGAIVLQHGDEAVYMYGASTQSLQRHMPTHMLQFEAMRWARERGCVWYDLWGIPPTDEPPESARDGQANVRSGLWGVYRFKQGFGGEVFLYPGVFERVYFPSLVRLWRRFRGGPGA